MNDELFVVCAKCPYYEVSASGIVRNVKSKKITTQRISNNGYKMITVFKKGTAKRTKHFKIHRLVAEAFIPNPDEKPEVDHRDGNRFNNCVQNLRWATRSENQGNKHRPNGIRNVYMTGSGKWVVKATHQNKVVRVGLYDTIEDGAKAYNKWVVDNGLQEWRPLNVV